MPDAVVSLRSARAFDGWVRDAIHALKYEGERARARHLGDMLTPLLSPGSEIDAIVPVPLHPSRLRHRGFNQASLLARRLASSLDELPLIEIARRGSTTPQVGLSSEDRVANVADAFYAPNPRALAGRHLGLVDDVITTTATMSACAAALVDAGAASVRCVSVARAV